MPAWRAYASQELGQLEGETRRIEPGVEEQGYLHLSGQLVERGLRRLIAGFEHEISDGVPLPGPRQ
jgi:hypothetical protein